MYYFYMAICYLSVRPSISYVLLAANIEDFRSLAKSFAPESLADQIIALAGDGQDRNHHTAEDTTTSEESSVEEAKHVRHKHKHSKEGSYIMKSVQSTTSGYELQLDDLVARVKERLQKELSLMATSKITPGPEDDVTYSSEVTTTEKTVAEVEPHRGQSHYGKKPNIPHQPEGDTGIPVEQERDVGHERYVENEKQDTSNVDETVHTSKYLEQNKRIPPKRKLSRPLRYKKVSTARDTTPYDTEVIRPKQTNKKSEEETVTEDILHLFQGMDMETKNDSYEDYVTPKKDDLYDEAIPPKSTTDKTYENLKLFTDELPSDDRIADSIGDGDETPNHYNKKTTETTTRYSKLRDIQKHEVKSAPIKKIQRRPKIKRLIASQATQTTKNRDRVLAYAEQLAVTDYEDEVVTATDELKARTESMSFDERAPVTPKYVPYNMTNPNLLHKHKNKKVQKAGTVIPKRDFYKMSSPNYLAKLPKTAETYNFNEPIPEGDREPEFLKPIGNPPASINGKVRLI